MKWKIVIVVLQIFWVAQGRAQLYLGISGGLTRNYSNTFNNAPAFTTYTAGNGFMAAVPIRYQMNDWFALQVEPSYIQKNYSIVRTGFFEGIRQDNRNGYLELPVMAHFSFGEKKWKGFLNLGVFGGYWTTATISGAEPNILNPVDSFVLSTQQPSNAFGINKPYNFNEKYSFSNQKDNRFEFGVVGGIGIEYDPTDQYAVFAEARYCQSLTDQQKNYMIHQISRYNQTYLFEIGVLFVANKLFHHTRK